MKITEYQLHRVHLKLPQPIGDSQVRFEDHWLTVLELLTDSGLAGVGFDLQQGRPTAGLAKLKEQFEYSPWPTIKDGEPFGMGLRLTRPRGGNVGSGFLSLAVETALWDLMAKFANLPLYRMLGGTNPKVRAYGSTLDFHLTDDEFRRKLESFRAMGFRAVKTKIGHPDLNWDLRRLGIVYEILGRKIDLMVDANEAWSVKVALLRAHAYRDAGFDIFWIEDPIARDDYAGYATLCAELPFTRINTGEYLEFTGKRLLLEHHAVDVMNVHGSIAQSRSAAHLAGDFGVPVSLGNTLLEIGVHLAASLPECLYMEYSDLVWNRLARNPIRIENGHAIAPDRPGHGIELDRSVLAQFSEPE